MAAMALMNLDAGEYPDEPEALWALFDVLNIACGGHAGDAASMDRVVAWCASHNCGVGAHPSYPDRAGFGRRTMQIEPAALRASIATQCEALVEAAQRHAQPVAYIKPHGALYHDAAASDALATAVLDAVLATLGRDVTVIGPPRGALRSAAESRGVRYAREGFADRRMRSDGSLVPRTEPNALLTGPDEAAAQARALAAQVDAICCHADTPGALDIARAVHQALHG